MNRESVLKSFFDTQGCGLEIGPSYNPLLPKSEGYNVKTIDYAGREDLIEKYQHTQNINLDKIEYVDFVSDGSAMSQVIGETDAYDFIVASHVIEHTPNLVGFLQDCGTLLNSGGKLVLAVPDKRYCFDYIQPLSTTGGTLQAWHENRTRPQPGMIFDSIASDVLRSGSIAWAEDCSDPITFNSSIEEAFRFFKHAQKTTDYIDVHVWRFVPSSFRMIIEDLHALGLIELREEQFVPGTGHEFYIALSKTGAGPRVPRIDLVSHILDELSEPEIRAHALARARIDDSHQQVDVT